MEKIGFGGFGLKKKKKGLWVVLDGEKKRFFLQGLCGFGWEK